jgi:hypothetical protein
MSLAEEIERFRVRALGPITFELDALEKFTTYMRDIEEVRRRGAEDLAHFFSGNRPDSYDYTEAPAQPLMDGGWPNDGYASYPPGHPAGLGPPPGAPPQQGYAPYTPPPPPPDYPPNGSGGYQNGGPPPLHTTPMGDILDRAHPGARRPR